MTIETVYLSSNFRSLDHVRFVRWSFSYLLRGGDMLMAAQTSLWAIFRPREWMLASDITVAASSRFAHQQMHFSFRTGQWHSQKTANILPLSPSLSLFSLFFLSGTNEYACRMHDHRCLARGHRAFGCRHRESSNDMRYCQLIGLVHFGCRFARFACNSIVSIWLCKVDGLFICFIFLDGDRSSTSVFLPIAHCECDAIQCCAAWRFALIRVCVIHL